MPFVGATGQRLNDELLDVGLKRSELFVLNAIACQPGASKSLSDMKHAADACRPAFEAQLAKLRLGVHAFAMGKWALYAVLGKTKGLKNGRGFIRPWPRGGSAIVSWHPTFAFFRNPYELGAFRADLERFKRLIEGKTTPPPKKIRWRVSPDQVEKLYRYALKTGEPLALDIETGSPDPLRPWWGKDPTMAVLKRVGLGTPMVGVSHQWGKDPVVEKILKRVIEDEAVTKILMNGKWFDQRVLARYGIHAR